MYRCPLPTAHSTVSGVPLLGSPRHHPRRRLGPDGAPHICPRTNSIPPSQASPPTAEVASPRRSELPAETRLNGTLPTSRSHQYHFRLSTPRTAELYLEVIFPRVVPAVWGDVPARVSPPSRLGGSGDGVRQMNWHTRHGDVACSPDLLPPSDRLVPSVLALARLQVTVLVDSRKRATYALPQPHYHSTPHKTHRESGENGILFEDYNSRT